ncbi:MAG: sodium:solute symporter family protein [Planctomycetota bacterium]|jgi:SSS family solute:Na+ symporter
MDATIGSWVVFVLYAAAVIGMGFWARNLHKKRQMEHKNLEFWMANRELPGWRLGISLTSGWLMLGWIGFGMSQIYAYGATGLWLLQIPWFFLTIIIIILVPFFRRVAAVSLPQAVGRRFGASARYLTAAFSACVFLSWTGAELVMVKTLVAPSLGFGEDLAVWALVLFIIPIIIYTVLGGFRAIITTDLIQFLIMVLFIIVLGCWAYSKASAAAPEGILAALKDVTPPWAGDKVTLNLNFLGWIFPVACLIGYLPGWLIEQDLCLRINAAPTTGQARVGAVLGFIFITTFIIVIPAIVAFCALIVFNPAGADAAAVGADYTGIILAFIQQMPAWLAVLMFLGLVACQMSTVDTFSNVTAMPLAYDLIQPIAMKNAPKEKVAGMARFITALAVILALVYAFIADTLGDVYYLSSGVLSASIAIPTLAIFWKRSTTPGVVIASLIGAIATFGMYYWEYKVLQYADAAQPNYYTDVLPVWLANGYGYLYIGTGVVASALTLIVVSLITPRSSEEYLGSVEALPVDDVKAIEAVSEQA